jgi:uncharacterized iron-regulated protein
MGLFITPGFSESGLSECKGVPMGNILKVLCVIILFQLSCLSNACATRDAVYRVSDGKTISFREMLSELKGVDLVFVGEVHTVHAHHEIQYNIITSMHSTQDIPMAVGFEMFTAESQDELNKWTGGTLHLNDFLEVYYKNWNFPWTLYKDIFLYVRDEGIPAIGLNMPPEITRKVSEAGFGALTDEELERLPPDIGCAVDESYMKFIRRAYAMHTHSGKEFVYFCQAQLLWDQVMARNLVDFLKKAPGSKVVVVTGNGHAWKGGIPEQIRILSKGISFKVVLPGISGYIDPGTVTQDDADYIVFPDGFHREGA